MAQRYCTNCGNELGPNDVFCASCGKPTHETAAVSTPEANVDVPAPPRQGVSDAPRASASTDESDSRTLSPPKGELEMWDYLVVVLGWPLWTFAAALLDGIVGAPSAYAAGTATAQGLINNFFWYGLVAVVFTYFTLLYSRSNRRKRRHEARVREARDQFYLDEAKKRGQA